MLMPLHIASINSGSNANCYYVGNEHEAVLVDAGLSCRETERRMQQLGLMMDKVKAIFISHEHSDHITGLPGLSKKFQLPVYITDATYRNSNIPLQAELTRGFSRKDNIQIGALTVTPFTKFHDAADPHSFIISEGAATVGVITDIGHACKQVLKYFSRCDAVFLESNYCPNMLEAGSYPYYLKERISSDEGHLSNQQAYKSPKLQLLILSHLSKNNNDPALVEKLFLPHAGDVQIAVASRYAAGPVYTIENETVKQAITPKRKNAKVSNQLSLF
jgi:phosphoribosyl 1,2-cyclic phosphodiesterase